MAPRVSVLHDEGPPFGKAAGSVVVCSLLLISFVLRAYLAIRGGQDFFGDEHRYRVGCQLYLAILQGDAHAVQTILGEPGHWFFPVITAGITMIQHLLAQLTPYGAWSNPANMELSMWISAVIMAFVYTLDLWLAYRIALNAGKNRGQAVWALVLLAGTNSLFYQSRHLLPYGCAMAVFLSGMLVGVGSPSPRRALSCGVLVGLGYHAYNGYWFLVPTVTIACLWWWREAEGGIRRCRSILGGLFLGLMVPVGIGYACAGNYYWSTMRAFSRTVTQGLFREGWSLPWEYFWHSEGLLLIGIGAVLLVAVAQRRGLPAHARLWLGLLAMSYGLLVLMSVGLEQFVVYARTVLPLWIFLALLGGWALDKLVGASRARWVAAFAVIVAIAGFNFKPHFSMVFPHEFEIAALRNFGNPKHTLSVSGSIYIPLGLPVTRPDLAMVNAQLLYPVKDYIGSPPGRIVVSLPHPLSYKPFQYESHTPRERAILREHDIGMKLIQLADPSLPDDLPVAYRYHSEDRPSGR